MRPVICMITTAGAPGEEGDGTLVSRIAAAARAGVHLVQIRRPGLEGRTLAGLVREAVRAVAGTRTRVLVNERVDVALASGAHGVHLRADGVPAARVRAAAPPGFLIGRSVHAPDEAERVARQGGLDYLTFGTVFSTPSKAGGAAAGVEALASACLRVPLPVLAIGGMTPDRLGEVGRAGAAGFAAIALFATCSVRALPAQVDHAARAFDSPAGVP
ncbi:MAG: thiamine phosphate synthase [Acidobacteria bacterium]|nr:thiamine phosphate synthase [Acidobacteriota bacterium]